MCYPLQVVEAFYEIKGSQFFAFLVPKESFIGFIAKMRIEHPKAVHFVNASRWFNTQGQIVESFSDDGEPKGTSGMPTLKVLRGYELIECGLVIVRYFGGVLLGSGGLVRAYTQSAKEAILKAQNLNTLIPYIPKTKQEVFISFSYLSQAEYLMKKMEIEVIKRSFQSEGVLLEITAPLGSMQSFLEALGH
ncbi:YigZ family protein [Helicobacter mesocricetorum]|uniref:YigZ family protein n=1 Tax=Helicobacter mesocricetorum TaxID=87012 RepID=UPI000CF08B00|nr:YigZ family protein [Helicobacter mesocricetorum]